MVAPTLCMTLIIMLLNGLPSASKAVPRTRAVWIGSSVRLIPDVVCPGARQPLRVATCGAG